MEQKEKELREMGAELAALSKAKMEADQKLHELEAEASHLRRRVGLTDIQDRSLTDLLKQSREEASSLREHKTALQGQVTGLQAKNSTLESKLEAEVQRGQDLGYQVEKLQAELRVLSEKLA
eukprot:RCo048998